VTLTRRNHGRGHSYKADGLPVPGVTRILEMYPKPALINWAGNTTAAYAVDHWAELDGLPPSQRLDRISKARFGELDAAARRGTQVHTLAESLAAGLDVDVPPELAGHVASDRDFLRRFNPEPIAIELIVCNREVGYCGTADLVAHMLGETWLLDLKTGRSGIFPEAALQVCAYSRAETYSLPPDDAEHPLADLGITRCGAVHVRGDGFDVYPLDAGPETWAYFRHLAALHAASETTREWVGEVLDPPLRAAS